LAAFRRHDEELAVRTHQLAVAEAGRYPEAIETARRALAIATEQRNYELVEALKASIARYESRTSR
jgi:hypothetical protein